jgi:steroid 5-alpha reductase family enzyme
MNYFLMLAVLLFGYMSLWFVVSLIKKRNYVADVAWGLGFILIAWTSFFHCG